MEIPQSPYRTQSISSLTSYAPSHQSYHSYRSVASDEIELTGNIHSKTTSSTFPEVKGWKPNKWSLNPKPAWEQFHNGTNTSEHGIVDRKKVWRQQVFQLHPKTIWTTIVHDIRDAPWKWFLRRFVSHVLPMIVIGGLVSLVVAMSLPDFIDVASGTVCKPDGTFMLSNEDYTPWQKDAIFTINIGHGSLSFGLAKFIDVSWDVVVGRGGQAMLAFFSYKVFTKALTRTMETSAVSAETFEAMTLQDDTFFGVLKLALYLFRIGSHRARSSMACTIISALFVLSVPTWLSAMTGYVADIDAFIVDKNGNLVPAKNFVPVIYTIHDGSRLGADYTDEYRVVNKWSSYGMIIDSGNDYGCSDLPLTYNASSQIYEWKDNLDPVCEMLYRTSWYAMNYGFLGLNNTNSTFYFSKTENITLSSPTLNITASLAIYEDEPDAHAKSSWYYYPFGVGWVKPNTTELPFQKQNPQFYYQPSDTVYNLTKINEKGSCQAPSDGPVRYKWGFSFLLVYAFVVTWLVWMVAMFAMYLDSFLHSRLDVIGRNMGIKRAVLDLSQAMHYTLDMDETTELKGNSEIQALVKEDLITYKNLPLDVLPPTRWSELVNTWTETRFLVWLKIEKWWVGLMLVFSALFIMSFFRPLRIAYWWCPYFAAFPGFGVFLVLLAGRNVRGRWLIFAIWFLMFWLGNVWWILKRKR